MPVGTPASTFVRMPHVTPKFLCEGNIKQRFLAVQSLVLMVGTDCLKEEVFSFVISPVPYDFILQVSS